MKAIRGSASCTAHCHRKSLLIMPNTCHRKHPVTKTVSRDVTRQTLKPTERVEFMG
jgi:hypothetical protein